MQWLPLVVVTFFVASCGPSPAPGYKKQVELPGSTPRSQPAINYDSCKKLVLTLRDSLQQEYNAADANRKEIILASCEKLFVYSVTEQLIPSWYGTPWDFNGTTQQPGKGAIACGYFITTLLQDAGISISRVKLAQLPSGQIIQQLAEKSSIQRFSNRPEEEVEEEIKKQGPGLYIAGLDFHTGFLYYDGQVVYFIHSNFINRVGVMKEPASASSPFYSSKYRVTGKISSNRNLLKNWLKV
jgi:hypothetical protein